MRRLPIQVADVVSVGYDVKTEVLEVEFRDGSIYQLYEVKAEVYELMMNRGSFRYDYFSEHIMREYLCRRI